MIIYVTHAYGGKQENIEKAKKITRDLQMNDLENCYICPLTAFLHLGNDNICPNDKNALRLDLESVSDVLLVASQVDDEMESEIEFAELVGMEVKYLEH